MNTVRSADGTTIAFTRAGQGPPLILVDGAMCSRSFGPMAKLAAQLTPHFTVYTYDRRGRGASGDTAPYAADREVEDIEALVALAGDTVFVHGTSSGAALALDAAKRIPAIGKLAVYEPPFIVDATRLPIPDGYLDGLGRLVAGGRRGDAVKMFMRFVGTPTIFTAVMPFTPVWPKLKAVAHTLPYDIAIVQDHQRGAPLAPAEWAAVKTPTLVAAGGKSPAWMTNATRALADALPDASYRTLPGQTHMVKESPEKWTGPYFNDQVGQAVGALMAPNDALLLGRVTYEGFAASFGGESGGMADQMNSIPKFVVSGTLASADWQNSTLISGNVAEQIGRLKQEPGGSIGMSGSSTLVSWLLRHGLLDLLVFPVVLGTGKRLFSEPDSQVPLTLTGSEAFSTGVVHLAYEPAA